MEIELNGKVIPIQTELTIGQYQLYKQNQTIYEKEPGRILSLYTGLDYSEIKNLPKKQVEFVQQYLTSNLMPSEIEDEVHNIFKYNDISYGLENNWNSLAWGAWVDLEVFAADNVESNIHRIMAILYRPLSEHKKKGYSIEPYKSEEIEERAELFKGLPVKYWFGAANYFFLINSVYMSNMQSSLNTTLKVNQLITKGWEILPKWIKRKLPLDSILHSPYNSPKMMSQKSNK